VKGPSCPSCGEGLYWRWPRRGRELDIERRRWYEFAGYRIYCPRCGVRLRSRGKGWFVAALLAFLFGNGLAHRAVADQWGATGLLALYGAWLVVLLAVWWRVRYDRFA
jgi:hypothetical protein